MKVQNTDLQIIISFYNQLMTQSLDNLDKAELIADDYLKLEKAAKKLNLLTEKLKEKYKAKEGEDINTLQQKANEEYFKLLEKDSEVEDIKLSKKELKQIEITPLQILTLKKYGILTE